MYEVDFIVTVCGEDITKLVREWRIEEVDNGISSMRVNIVNVDMLFSGLFQCDNEVEIAFGYPGDLSNRVSMDIVGVSEIYSADGLFIEVLCQDNVRKIHPNSIRAMAKKGASPSDVITSLIGSSTGKNVNCKLKFDKMSANHRLPAFGSYLSVVGFYSLMSQPSTAATFRNNRLFSAGLGQPSVFQKPMTVTGLHLPTVNKSEPSKTPPDPGKDQDGKKSADGKSPSPTKQTNDKDLVYHAGSISDTNSVDNNRANNLQNNANDFSVTGVVELVWSPELRAKKCITVVNCGPENSGDWYVKKCEHHFSVASGGRTRLTLSRYEPEQEQKDSKSNAPKIKAANSIQGAQ
jgi:ribosomal protein S16